MGVGSSQKPGSFLLDRLKNREDRNISEQNDRACFCNTQADSHLPPGLSNCDSKSILYCQRVIISPSSADAPFLLWKREGRREDLRSICSDMIMPSYAVTVADMLWTGQSKEVTQKKCAERLLRALGFLQAVSNSFAYGLIIQKLDQVMTLGWSVVPEVGGW